MRLLLRGYAVGMVAVLLAVATLGYYLAGRALSAEPQNPGLNPIPKGTAVVFLEDKLVQLEVYRVSNPRQYMYVHQQDLEDRGIWYSFSQPHDEGWSGEGLSFATSVAFLDSQGSILRILTVEPCPSQARTCPVYQPQVVYSKALEVREGWFEQHQIREGGIASLKSFSK